MDEARMRLAKAVFVAAGVVGLGLVVAATASAPATSRTGRFVPQDTLREGLGSVVRMAVIAFFFVMLYEVMTGFGGRLKVRRFGQGSSSQRLSLLILALLALGVTVLVVRQRLRVRVEPRTGEIVGEDGFVMPAPVGSPAEEPVASVLPGPGWQLWAIALLGLVATGYLVYRSRRKGAAGTRPPRETVTAAETTEQSSPRPPDDRRPIDPAGRVVAAYLGVEWAAEMAGLPRAGGETIRGHLGRVGTRTDVDSARSLASVYEVARYSPFAIGETEAEIAERAEAALTEQFG